MSPPNQSPWPRITLITATLNRSCTLEETIRSVLGQDYPNLEYFIMDGGSRDGTALLLDRYRAYITACISEPDGGQASALNKALQWASGDLIGWINSDDILLPDALHRLATAFRQRRVELLLANVINEDLERGGKWEVRQRNVHRRTMTSPWKNAVTWHQPGTFFTRRLLERTGPLREDFHNLFDWEWMCRALQHTDPSYLDIPVAAFRIHRDAKTSRLGESWMREKRALLCDHACERDRRESNLFEACLDLSLAQDCWALQVRQRREGWRYFLQALSRDWRILSYHRTWVTALKSLLPLPIQAQVRSFLKGH